MRKRSHQDTENWSKTLFLLCCALLSGCLAPMPSMSSSWHRADTTKAQTHADLAAARAEAMRLEPIQTPQLSGVQWGAFGSTNKVDSVGASKAFQRPAGQERFEEIIRSIMESKGYRLAR